MATLLQKDIPDHHAVLFAPVMYSRAPLLIDSLRSSLGVSGDASVDAFVYHRKKFTIDAVREVRHVASQKAFTKDAKKHFFIASESILSNAQNGLLKLFEDPPSDTYFYLFVPEGRIIIPTLRSRMAFVHCPANGRDRDLADSFINGNTKARSDILKTVLTEKQKDMEGIERLLASVEEVLGDRATLNEKERRLLSEIYFVREYLRDPAPSAKLLLEHLASV